MINTDTFTIDIHWDQKKGFFLWASDEPHHSLPVEDWKKALFTWHKESFYGSTLLSEEYYNKKGVWLSPLNALTFFAIHPVSRIVQPQWSAEVEQLREIAPAIVQALEEGQFLPDVEAWKTGERGWKLHGQVLQDIRNNTTSHRDNEPRDSLSALKLYDVDAWISQAIEERIEQQPNFSMRWKQDNAPFSVCLRLQEPDSESPTWRLRVLLQDKKKKNRVHEWNSELKRSIPKEWQLHTQSIAKEIDLWIQIVPWLDGGEQERNIIRLLSEDQAWRFLTEESFLLVEMGVVVLLPSWWESITSIKPILKAKMKTSVGSSAQAFFGLDTLVDFNWKIAIGNTELSEKEFRQLLENNKRLISIQGQWFQINPAFIEKLKRVMNKVEKKGLPLRDVLENQAYLFSIQGEQMDQAQESKQLEDDDEPGDNHYLQLIQVEVNQHLAEWLDQLQEIRSIPAVEIPTAFQGELRPYQKQGFSWLLFLRRFGLGGILADDMGLGKTIQTIAYFLSVQEQREEVDGLAPAPALLICPTSVLGNWQKELERFAPSLKVYIHYGHTRAKAEAFLAEVQAADIVLTSYGHSHLDQEELCSITWDSICLDEAQNIKNAYTKQAKAIQTLQAQHRIALTGTPVENRLTELWSIMNYINPGYLGSLHQFQQRFVLPIEKEQDSKKITQVQRLIRPFLLRRTKTDPSIELDLPEKEELKVYAPLSKEQTTLYEALVQDTLERVQVLTGMERKGLVLAMINKLKQICNHPALYLKESSPYQLQDRSAKLEELLQIVQRVREQKESCLIFTQFIDMGHMIQSYLKNILKEEAVFLHGSTKKTKRDEMISDFQEGKFTIFILSLKAGGTGLNLTAANHVIHFDRWWNPAVENQATDRAHRIGQEKYVQVHKLITLGTLEERIDEMLERKLALSDQIMRGESWVTELSTAELRELFVLRKKWME